VFVILVLQSGTALTNIPMSHKLLNRYEEITYSWFKTIADKCGALVFPKVPVAETSDAGEFGSDNVPISAWWIPLRAGRAVVVSPLRL
jgi:hypothetical protein